VSMPVAVRDSRRQESQRRIPVYSSAYVDAIS
jgi:hypothetical protein